MPASFLQRALTLTTLLLTPILLTISLSLTLKAIYSPSFAEATWQSASTDLQGNTLYTPTNSTLLASPFYNCTTHIPIDPATGAIDTSVTVVNTTCVRRPFLGSKGYTACPQSQFEVPTRRHICQKITSAASLYVAGAVLVGLGTLAAWVTAFGALFASKLGSVSAPVGYVALPGESKHHHHKHGDAAVYAVPESVGRTLLRVLASTVVLLAVLGAGCLVAGQFVGVDALVNDQRPGVNPSDSTIYSRWYMGKASLVYTTVAYVFGFVGALLGNSRFMSV